MATESNETDQIPANSEPENLDFRIREKLEARQNGKSRGNYWSAPAKVVHYLS